MSLVNLDGLVILGPGSEWFWTMAEFVVVSATLIAIYMQVRDARSAALHDHAKAWDDEWNSHDFALMRLRLLVDLEGRPVEAGLPDSVGPVSDYFQRMGRLVIGGQLRALDVFEALRSPIGRYWSLLEPWLLEERRRQGLPLLHRFEQLELEMRKFDRKTIGRELDLSTDRAGLAAAIEQLEAYLRVVINERNGILPSATRRSAGETDGAAGAA